MPFRINLTVKNLVPFIILDHHFIRLKRAISILPQCYGWWWNNLLQTQTPDLADYSWFDLRSDYFFSKNSNSSDFFGILSNCGLYLIGGFAKILSPSVICKFSLGCVVFITNIAMQGHQRLGRLFSGAGLRSSSSDWRGINHVGWTFQNNLNWTVVGHSQCSGFIKFVHSHKMRFKIFYNIVTVFTS